MVSGRSTSYLATSQNAELFAVEEPRCSFGKDVSVFYGQASPRAHLEHRHDQAQLVLTYEGVTAEITWVSGDKNRHKKILVGETFCLIPPGVAHTCRWAPKTELVILYLEAHLLPRQVKELPVDVVIADFRVLSRLDNLLWSLADELRKIISETPAPTSATISALGAVLAGRILDRHFAQTEENLVQNRLPPSVLMKVSELIDREIKGILNTRTLAKHVGLSPEHFARLFKRSTGMPPVQYIAKCRVQKALELLRTGNYRVADVACEVGFYDQSHLDRHCRKFFGFPPKVVLRKALKTF